MYLKDLRMGFRQVGICIPLSLLAHYLFTRYEQVLYFKWQLNPTVTKCHVYKNCIKTLYLIQCLYIVFIAIQPHLLYYVQSIYRCFQLQQQNCTSLWQRPCSPLCPPKFLLALLLKKLLTTELNCSVFHTYLLHPTVTAIILAQIFIICYQNYYKNLTITMSVHPPGFSCLSLCKYCLVLSKCMLLTFNDISIYKRGHILCN